MSFNAEREAARALLPERVKGDALRRSLYFTTLGWFFGAFWFAAAAGGATLNRFVEYFAPLGQKDFFIGLVTAAASIGVLLQIPGALRIEHIGIRKPFFLRWLTTQRVIYLVIAILPWVLPAHSAWAALLLTALIIGAWGCQHFGGQAWVNWMGDLVPARVRGKYFGRRSRIGIVVMAVTSVLMGVVLDLSGTVKFNEIVGPWAEKAGMPPLLLVISIIFFFAAIAGILDIQCFHKVDEPRMKAVIAEPMFKRLVRPLRDRDFRGYVLYLFTWMSANGFAAPFWWVYLLSFFDLLKSQGSTAWWLNWYYVAAYIMLPIAYHVGQFAGYPVWGRMVDRFGRKPIIFISSMTHTLTWVFWLFLTPDMLFYCIPAQFIGGFFGSGQEIANFNMMLGFNRKGGAAYQAVASVITNVGMAGTMFFGGVLATAFLKIESSYGNVFTLSGLPFGRYQALIIIALMLKIFADVILLTRVHDPEAKPTAHAARFLIENLYGNLDSVIFTPLRRVPDMTTDAVRLTMDVTTDAARKVGEVTTDTVSKIGDVAEDAVEGVRKIFRS